MKNALCISHVSVKFPSGLKLLVRSWNYKPALIITETELMQMRICYFDFPTTEPSTFHKVAENIWIMEITIIIFFKVVLN